SSVTFMASGGASASPEVKHRLLELVPHAILADVGGASETGSQLSQINAAGRTVEATTFVPAPTTCVVDDERTRVVEPGHEGIGWLAQRGAIPLGYLGDPEKTAATFPLVAGERMSIPGDRARVRSDGLVELLGRESVTVNTGGEKVFAEEVEQALVRHPDVLDAIVVGRPSERWGQEIVAVVQLRPGADVTDDDLVAASRDQLAGSTRQ